MRYLFSILALLVSVSVANAQAPTKLCITTTGKNCIQIDATNPLPITGGTAGGTTSAKVISTASTNSNLVIAGAHNLYEIAAINTNATIAYLKFYDKVTAPACNTDPVIAVYQLVQNVPVTVPSIVGKSFSTGIGLCITGGLADNDNTNATTGITVSLGYK